MKVMDRWAVVAARAHIVQTSKIPQVVSNKWRSIGVQMSDQNAAVRHTVDLI
jgi:hypothetical protein